MPLSNLSLQNQTYVIVVFSRKPRATHSYVENVATSRRKKLFNFAHIGGFCWRSGPGGLRVDSDTLVQEQKAWLRKRDVICGEDWDIDHCLEELYRARLRELATSKACIADAQFQTSGSLLL